MARAMVLLLAGLFQVVPAQDVPEPVWSTKIADLRKAVEADPDNIGLRLRLARMLLKPDLESAHPDKARARLEEARKNFAIVLEKKPDSREALRARVVDTYANGDYESTLDAGRKYLDVVKVDADVTLYIIRSLLYLKRDQDACEEFVKWVRAGSIRSFGEAQGMIVLLLADRKRAGMLQSAFEKALKEDPDNINLLLYGAVFMAQVGRNMQAWTWLHEAEKRGLCGLATGHRHAFVRDLLERTLEPDEGAWSYPSTQVEELARCCKEVPDHAGLAMRVARVLDTSGRSAEALAWYRKVSESNPGLWSAWYRMGQLHAREKRFAEAAVCFEKTLAVQPGYELARLQLAHALIKSGKVEEGVKTFVPFAKSFPPERHTRRILEALKEQETGLQTLQPALETALRNDPDSPWLHAHLALVLHHGGRKTEARKEALLAERHGLVGPGGRAHPVLYEVFDKSSEGARVRAEGSEKG